MATYLSMNGTASDYLQLPSMNYDTIEIDCYVILTRDVSRYYFDNRGGGGAAFFYSRSVAAGGTENISGATVYLNGVQQTAGTAFVPDQTRCTLKGVITAAYTGITNVFSYNVVTAGITLRVIFMELKCTRVVP
jgi:hypothetical protein